VLNVFEAAANRVRFVFAEFPRVVVSVSGGKDSTCLFYLCAAEAERTGRKFEVFFLDQEAEYQSTIDVIDAMMRHPLAIPRWYQVPIRMTNATSHRDVFLHAWEPGKKWVFDKSPLAIHAVAGEYPDRFYDFFPWHEVQGEPAAHLVGLRIFESMNRQRTMLKANGYRHYKWSTACKRPGSFKFYPIFDWQPRDVWKYIADACLPYNAAYDRMVARHGVNLRTMRVSNLIHEQAFRSLAQLQEFEPETYDRLVARLGGVHAAAMYADEDSIFSAERKPACFATWRSYRDHILDTTPTEVRDRYRKRFAGQDQDERTYQWQVKQLLLNDWEGKLPRTTARAGKLRELWWHRL